MWVYIIGKGFRAAIIINCSYNEALMVKEKGIATCRNELV
jgi:hypothetical protein